MADPKEPRTIPTDPYIQALGGDNILKWEPPPAAAAPMSGENSVLRLHVPAEQTELDFGAGKTPGILMATDNHVHMTARSPRTTISLGSPGGDGIGDPALGLQVFTAGEKRETVDGSTIEWYKGTKAERVFVNLTEDYQCPKTETVKGPWQESCANAKTETVAGTVTQSFNSEHILTVGKPALHTFAASKEEHVGGDWVVHVKRDRKWHLEGDDNRIWKGCRMNLTGGINNDIFMGVSFSNNISIAITNAAVKFDCTQLKSHQGSHQSGEDGHQVLDAEGRRAEKGRQARLRTGIHRERDDLHH